MWLHWKALAMCGKSVMIRIFKRPLSHMFPLINLLRRHCWFSLESGWIRMFSEVAILKVLTLQQHQKVFLFYFILKLTSIICKLCSWFSCVPTCLGLWWLLQPSKWCNCKKTVELKFILVLFTDNSTHLIQPLDIAVFKLFQSLLKKLFWASC